MKAIALDTFFPGYLIFSDFKIILKKMGFSGVQILTNEKNSPNA
jgi:hypothetical protein